MAGKCFALGLGLGLFFSTHGFSKALLVPEYFPQKTVFLTLVPEGENTVQFERLAKIMAVLQSKSVPTTVFVGMPSCEQIVEKKGVYDGYELTEAERKRGIVAKLEQRANHHCGRDYGSCSMPRIHYICLSHHSHWLRNEFPLETLDEKTRKPIRYSVGRRSSIIPALKRMGETIDSIPIKANGPASFSTDTLGGNLYASTDLWRLNPDLSPAQIEETLRKSLTFKTLVWLKPNPWERSMDLDTVVMFAKSKDGNIHAFLATHPKSVLRAAGHVDGYTFFTKPYPTKEELLSCESIQSFEAQGSSRLCWELALRDDESMRAHWKRRIPGSLDREIQARCPAFTQLKSCLERVASEKNNQAWENDRENYATLKASGFPEERIHLVENAGIYQTGFNLEHTQAPGYVNGLIVEDRYIMPTYPSMKDLDPGLDYSQIPEVQSAFLEISESDLKAQEAFESVFDRVVTVRSDGLTGGAIHCTTFSHYREPK